MELNIILLLALCKIQFFFWLCLLYFCTTWSLQSVSVADGLALLTFCSSE